ncbi:unnamed protein product [Gongylonema pulchrum]|uniref:Uncharacterized protein n=1 Tax=Gongylonema pulchrum TaxID=637853 RepID=A0A183E3N6_9BILA|nr:unnamed protein product [Gongylonema pulchrum]
MVTEGGDDDTDDDNSDAETVMFLLYRLLLLCHRIQWERLPEMNNIHLGYLEFASTSQQCRISSDNKA